jgi:hypothetical protein
MNDPNPSPRNSLPRRISTTFISPQQTLKPTPNSNNNPKTRGKKEERPKKWEKKNQPKSP